MDEFINESSMNEEAKEVIINLVDNIAILLEGGMSIEQLKKEALHSTENEGIPDELKDAYIKIALLKNEQTALTLLGLQMGKIYSTTAYGNKPRKVGYIEGKQNYSGRGWELKKACEDLGSGEIYCATNDFATSCKNQVGYFKAGKIYSGKKESMSLLRDQVGYFEAGKIYRGTGNSASQVGIYDGGYSTGVAAAFFLIL